MQKKYLFVLPTAKIGGAERVVFNIIQYLLSINESVTLVTMSHGKGPVWENLQHYSNFQWIAGKHGSEKSSLIPITLQLIILDRKNKYDYVFSTHIHINSFLNSLKSLGIFKNSIFISRESSLVFERNRNYKKYFYKLMYKFFYGNQDLIICQTEEMKKSLIENLGFRPADKIEVIPNPVNIDYIHSQIHKTVKKDYIIACGRLIKLKQFQMLIAAFSKISPYYPEYKLIILGDGIERENLLELIRKESLCEKVFLLGRISNPFKWFACSKIGIVTSEIEGFPNVLLEMMASGVNQLVSTPCVENLVDIPGLVVTEDCSENSIYDSLSEVLKVNKDLSEKYISYISQEHSVYQFWNTIMLHLGVS